jgi:uncharacterized membrane protein YkvA (DUF1232 family)
MQAQVSSVGSFTVRGALFELKTRARALKRDVHAVYLAAGDPRVPWYAKALALAVAGYALSPIDLIPDFIPVIGYLDDMIVVPLGIWLVLSLIPREVMAQYRAEANEAARRPRNWGTAIIILAIWIVGAVALGWAALAHWERPDQVAAIATQCLSLASQCR